MKGMHLYAQEKGIMAPPPGTLIRAHVHMRDSAFTRSHVKPDHEEKPCKAYDARAQKHEKTFFDFAGSVELRVGALISDRELLSAVFDARARYNTYLELPEPL
jgi:hypothetical protein